MIHYPPNTGADPVFLGICAAVAIITFAWVAAQWRKEKEKAESLSRQKSKMFDDIEVKANYIKTKIESCWDEEKLTEWLGHIRQFKNDYHYYVNSKYYNGILNGAYESQKTLIYKEQLRVDVMLREMQLK